MLGLKSWLCRIPAVGFFSKLHKLFLPEFLHLENGMIVLHGVERVPWSNICKEFRNCTCNIMDVLGRKGFTNLACNSVHFSLVTGGRQSWDSKKANDSGWSPYKLANKLAGEQTNGVCEEKSWPWAAGHLWVRIAFGKHIHGFMGHGSLENIL